MAIGSTNFSQFNIKTNANYSQLPVNSTTQTKPYPNDSFELSTKKEKSSTKGWLLAGGIFATLAIGAMILKGKMSAVKELAEHIDFKPAQTIKEARAFAKQHLGIHRFDIEDLEVANYVNEGLVEAVNKTKGKIVLPNAVDTIKVDGEAIMNYGKNLLGERVVGINPKGASWDNLSEFLPKIEDLQKNGCPKDQIERIVKETEELKLKYEKGSFVERVNLAHQIEKNYAKVGFGKYHELFHELGHLQHEYTNPQQFKKWAKYTGYDALDYAKKNHDVPAEIDEHISELNKYKGIANLIGEYAAIYPGEFVAEMYGHMLSGKKLCPELMELYNKYGGPKIPA